MDRRTLLLLGGSSLLAYGCKVSLFDSPVEESYYTGHFSSMRASESKSGGFTRCQGTTCTSEMLENEIHSIVHSAALNIKVFIPQINQTSYIQVGDGPLRPFYPAPGHSFYGHGCIDDDRRVLYTTQAPQARGTSNEERKHNVGVIHVYSLPDAKLIGEFPSYGNDPHEIRRFGDELVVCNGGANSNVAFINAKTKELIRKYEGTEDHISLRHLDRFDESHYVIGSMSRDLNKSCPLFNLNRETGLTVDKASQAVPSTVLRHQLLSVLCYNGFTFATCPLTDGLFVWTRAGELVAVYKIPGASSLIPSKKHGGILVGTWNDAEPAYLVELIGNAIKTTKLSWGGSLNGSHAMLVS